MDTNAKDTARVNGLFGISHIVMLDYATKIPRALYRVLQEFSVERNQESVKLTGGNVDGAWDTEAGEAENPLNITVREFPLAGYKLLDDANVTELTAEANGYVGTPVNTKGTSVSGSTGISAITITTGNGSKVPFGKLSFVAKAAGKVDIYAAADLSGLGMSFLSDDGLIAADVAVSATPTILADLGLTITGATTPAMIPGDAMSVEVRGTNNGVRKIDVGGSSTKYVTLLAFWPKRGDGRRNYAEVYKVSITSKTPIKGVYRDWAEYSITGEMLIEPCKQNLLYTLYQILGEAGAC